MPLAGAGATEGELRGREKGGGMTDATISGHKDERIDIQTFARFVEAMRRTNARGAFSLRDELRHAGLGSLAKGPAAEIRTSGEWCGPAASLWRHFDAMRRLPRDLAFERDAREAASRLGRTTASLRSRRCQWPKPNDPALLVYALRAGWIGDPIPPARDAVGAQYIVLAIRQERTAFVSKYPREADAIRTYQALKRKFGRQRVRFAVARCGWIEADVPWTEMRDALRAEKAGRQRHQ